MKSRAATKRASRWIQPTASVVICAYSDERWTLLQAAVDSVLSQVPAPREVVVVVDHNPALARRARAEFAQVIVVENRAPVGLSNARNTGVAASGGDVVAFLDDDAAAEPGWLAGLLVPFRDADVMVSGGRIEPIWHDARPRWFPPEFDWVVGCSFVGQSNGTAARNPLGASMAIRRRVFETVGGFDAAIGRVGTRPVGAEETELAVRMRSHWPGARVVMRDDSVVRHHVPQRRGRVSYFLARCWAEGRSKAILRRLTGGAALDTERSYARHTLPRGAGRGLRQLLGGDGWGAARALAIAAGLLTAVAGFTVERLTSAVLPERRTGLRTELIGPTILFVVAAWLWAAAVPAVDIGAMNDFGLISVLPAQAFIALALLSAGAAILLRANPLPRPLLALHVVALVVMLNAIPILTEQVPRFGATWVHAGFTDYVIRTGGLAPAIDARFNWPGFFILAAMLTQLGGLSSPLALAGWAPVYFSLLYALPLAVIFRSLVRDERLVWAGLWLFFLSDWIGQDYWAPQALAYFFFLAILATVVTYLRSPGHRPVGLGSRFGRLRLIGPLLTGVFANLAIDPQRVPTPPRQAVGLLCAMVVIFAWVAMSHEVTPFFMVSALAALVLAGRLVTRTLPLLFAVIAVAWVSFMTVTFLAGHATQMLQEIGQLGGTVSENITNRVSGSPAHELVVRIRLLMTGALWLVAIVGAWRLFRAGQGVVVPLLLALSPIPLIAFQSYGGELVLRVFFFSLPFVALLAAATAYGRGLPGWRRTAAVSATCAVLGVAFLTARYGNERSEAFTRAEVDAVNWTIEAAPPRSLLLAAWPNLPWLFRSVERFDWLSDHDPPAQVDPARLRDLLAEGNHPAAFLVLTRSEGNYAEAFEGGPPGVFDTGIAALLAQPGMFRLVYRNVDAAVFVPAAQATP